MCIKAQSFILLSCASENCFHGNFSSLLDISMFSLDGIPPLCLISIQRDNSLLLTLPHGPLKKWGAKSKGNFFRIFSHFLLLLHFSIFLHLKSNAPQHKTPKWDCWQNRRVLKNNLMLFSSSFYLSLKRYCPLMFKTTPYKSKLVYQFVLTRHLNWEI